MGQESRMRDHTRLQRSSDHRYRRGSREMLGLVLSPGSSAEAQSPLIRKIETWSRLYFGEGFEKLPLILKGVFLEPALGQHALVYRRTSISGTTFSGKTGLSGTIFHAI
jgi:hypothetical protein